METQRSSHSNPIQNSGVFSSSIKKSKVQNEKRHRFVCVLCQRSFKEHNFFIEHFRSHGKNEIDLKGCTNEKNEEKGTKRVSIQCEWCPESFACMTKAIQHKYKKHRYKKNYFCKICGKLFPLLSAIEEHTKTEHSAIHLEETIDKNLIITESLKTIKMEPQLESDEIGSASNSMLKCQFCSATFQSYTAVNHHEADAHKLEKQILSSKVIVLPLPSKKIRINNSNEINSLYYCHLCGAEYMVKYNLRKHLEVYHTLEEKNAFPSKGLIKCKACEAVFYSKKAYDAHNLNHKPDDLYVTSEEQRQKVVARVDQDFDVRRVPNSKKKKERKTLQKWPSNATTPSSKNSQIECCIDEDI